MAPLGQTLDAFLLMPGFGGDWGQRVGLER